jgi:hypothetical protein
MRAVERRAEKKERKRGREREAEKEGRAESERGTEEHKGSIYVARFLAPPSRWSNSVANSLPVTTIPRPVWTAFVGSTPAVNDWRTGQLSRRRRRRR